MYAKLAIHTVICVACFTTGWTVHKWKNEATQLEASKSAIRQLERAHEETAFYADKLNSAQKAATLRENSLERDRRRIDSVNNRLRDQLATAAISLPSATCGSSAEYAATVNAVFNECRSVLVEMGIAAQGHAIDSKKLIDSWPSRN